MFYILAAGGPPPFFLEIAALLVASALMAYLGNRLRIVPIVAFLVTGALIGPHALGLVRDPGLIEAAAEVGVVLLLFTIGIEFSLARLARMKRVIFVGGGLQVGLVVGLVTLGAAAFGIDWRVGVFTGCLVALSSTAIVMKLLMDRGATGSEGGQAALGILIFQDLAVVAMVLLVPVLGGAAASAWTLPLALGKATLLVVVVVLVARRLMPKVLEAVARTCSQEIFVLTVVAVCFGTALVTSWLGVSLSLGAFLAGLMVSESRFSELATGEILPLQILFSATFFVSVGLLLDVGFLVRNPLLVLATLGAVLLLKTATTALGLRVLGFRGATLWGTGLLLAQVGEFSFVLERSGREVGLFPAGFEDGGPQAFLAVTVLLMIATPFLSRLGERFRSADGAAPSPGEGEIGDSPAEQDIPELRDHVLLAGYGEGARRLARALTGTEIPFLVLTLSPDGARHAEAAGIPVLRGNYLRQHELGLASIREARLLVVADDDLETTRRVVRAARALAPDLRIVTRTRFETEIEELREAGADRVAAEDLESTAALLEETLSEYGIDPEAVRRLQEALRSGTHAATTSGPTGPEPIRLSEEQAASSRCRHVQQTRPVFRSADGCEECLRTGDRWVHLRICMTCGHVGCCDASNNRHATAHHRATDHPVVKSAEPGEDWAWCYVDEEYL